jgi:hypothetical protein
MRHIISDVSDIPVLPPVVDRRRGPADRRAVWRGGRRDSDWLTRPPGVLSSVLIPATASAFRRAILSVLNI